MSVYQRLWRTHCIYTPGYLRLKLGKSYAPGTLILIYRIPNENLTIKILYFHCAATPIWPEPPHYRGFTITHRRTTVGRIPLDEWSARRRDFYVKTHNIHKKQTSIPSTGLEPAIPASKSPQTDVFELAATGICKIMFSFYNLWKTFTYYPPDELKKH
jgi:hypothetical protein